MKLRVLFLKKTQIIYLATFLIACILLSFFLFTPRPNTVFNIVDENQTIKADFTGDGSEDILYIKTEKDKYYIQINSKNQSYYLTPDKKFNTVGYFYDYWPMKVTLLDITNDKIPEIFVQASQDNNPVQHIFQWTGKDFRTIYSGTSNLIGFLDSKNSKIPKVITGNISSKEISYNYNIFMEKELHKISYEKNLPGSDIIPLFVKYIESLPYDEGKLPKDIFSDEQINKIKTSIGNLCSQDNIYTFQDGNFMDTAFDNNGDSQVVQWNLSFRGVSKTNANYYKGYNLSVILKNSKSDKEKFKIFSIEIK
jgi:hypothetical protein